MSEHDPIHYEHVIGGPPIRGIFMTTPKEVQFNGDFVHAGSGLFTVEHHGAKHLGVGIFAGSIETEELEDVALVDMNPYPDLAFYLLSACTISTLDTFDVGDMHDVLGGVHRYLRGDQEPSESPIAAYAFRSSERYAGALESPVLDMLVRRLELRGYTLDHRGFAAVKEKSGAFKSGSSPNICRLIEAANN